MPAKMSIPDGTAKGDIVQIKVLVPHPMETGYRREMDGSRIPRNIIRELRCEYNGNVVFRADLHPAIAANPFFAFYHRADKSGKVTLYWEDEEGEHSQSAPLLVA